MSRFLVVATDAFCVLFQSLRVSSGSLRGLHRVLLALAPGVLMFRSLALTICTQPPKPCMCHLVGQHNNEPKSHMMCLQAGLRILMQRHALGSATLEDVLAALVDGLAAVSGIDDTGVLPVHLTRLMLAYIQLEWWYCHDKHRQVLSAYVVNCSLFIPDSLH